MTAGAMARRWLPGSLGGRLLAGAVLLGALAIGAATLVDATLLYRFVRGQVDGRLDAQIVAVTTGLQLGPDGRPSVAPGVASQGFGGPGPGWYWQIETPGGVARSSGLGQDTLRIPDDLPRPPHRPGEDSWPADLMTAKGDRLVARISERVVAGRPVRVIATAPRAALVEPMRKMLLPLALSMATLAGLLLVAVVFGVRLGLAPLARLRREVAGIRAGEAERLPMEGRPLDVVPLVAELNTLLDENDAGLERARRNVANLAHGLKTPLATLAVTLAEPGRDPDRVLAPLVATMDRQIRHHLARARAAAIGGPGRLRTDVMERLRDLALVMGKLHGTRGVVVELDGPDMLTAACEAQDLDELFGNLLDNACTHARGRVRVRGAAAGRGVRIDVEDDGPGMSKAEMQSAVAPGNRLDESTLGYGFGLAISREIAELYGGGLALSRSELGGLRVRVTLPAL